MANFWGVHWPHATGSEVNRLVLDPTDNYTENPMAVVFEMFGEIMGGMKVKCSSSIKGVYDIAVLNEVTNELNIYLINKKQSATLSTGIVLKNHDIGIIKTTSFIEGSNKNGTLIELATSIENGNRLLLDLPKNSLTKVTIKL